MMPGFSTRHRNGRNSASFAKSRAFAVITVIPNRPALIAINASFVKRVAKVHRRDYNSSGVFTSRAIADPSLVKSRTFQVSKIFEPAFRAQ